MLQGCQDQAQGGQLSASTGWCESKVVRQNKSINSHKTKTFVGVQQLDTQRHGTCLHMDIITAHEQTLTSS